MSPDQAAGLRHLFTQRGPQIIAVTSPAMKAQRNRLLVEAGAALAAAGRRVLLIDENPLPKNPVQRTIDFDTLPEGDLLQVMRGERSLASILCRIDHAGFDWVSACRLAQTDMPRTRQLTGLVHEISTDYDYVLIDCASSDTSCLTSLAGHADHLVVMTRGDSHGITQTYAQIKRMARGHGCNDFQLLVVSDGSRDEARIVYSSLRRVAHEHLGLRLAFLGMTPPNQGAPLASLLDNALPHAVANTPQSVRRPTLQGA